MIHTDR